MHCWCSSAFPNASSVSKSPRACSPQSRQRNPSSGVPLSRRLPHSPQDRTSFMEACRGGGAGARTDPRGLAPAARSCRCAATRAPVASGWGTRRTARSVNHPVVEGPTPGTPARANTPSSSATRATARRSRGRRPATAPDGTGAVAGKCRTGRSEAGATAREATSRAKFRGRAPRRRPRRGPSSSPRCASLATRAPRRRESGDGSEGRQLSVHQDFSCSDMPLRIRIFLRS